MRHVVVLIDGLSVLDVNGESASSAAFGCNDSICAARWHFNVGGNGVRCVLGPDGRGFGDLGSLVVSEIRASGDQAWAQPGVATFGESVVERKNIVFLCLDPE